MPSPLPPEFRYDRVRSDATVLHVLIAEIEPLRWGVASILKHR
jgi:hypothetical protein